MPGFRLLSVVLAVAAAEHLSTCRGPGEPGAPSAAPETTASSAPRELPEVDVSELTQRERREWDALVGELLAPCPDTPVSIAQCVAERRTCSGCLPAARFLVRQVRRGMPRSRVEASFRARFSAEAVKSFDLTDLPFKGPADAPVTIVEWADFECPFCKAASPLFDQKVKAYPRLVRLVFRQYPLAIHPNAEFAARASLAAHRQGRFWDMHAALFGAESLEKKTVEKLAEQLGLDMKRFRADVASEAVADAVARDRKAGDAAGLSGTPFVFVNGRHFDLELFDLTEDLDDWIQLEVEQRTGKRPSPVAEAAPSAGAPRNAKSAEAPPKSAPAGSH